MPLDPINGYNIAASVYRQWHWFEFWRVHEAPIVRSWLATLPAGIGLDAGSGVGPYSLDMSLLGQKCVALDSSAAMLEIREREMRKAGLFDSETEQVVGELTALPFSTSRFDWILCTRVLSHVSDVGQAMSEFSRVLKPGGECFITDVHPRHPYDQVSVNVGELHVEIATYKHSLVGMQEMAATYGMVTLEMRERYFDDLKPSPPFEKFEKLWRNRQLPVFYTWHIRKPL